MPLSQQNHGTLPMGISEQQIRPMTPDEALRKLGSVPVGRVLFTRRWLPAIRFVNHLLDDGEIIFRGDGAEIAAPGAGDDTYGGVAYETGETDPVTGSGWNVTVIGPAHLVIDPRKAAFYSRALSQWSATEENQIIGIRPQVVTGYELVAIRAHSYPVQQGLPAPRAGM